ncbi:MAG: YveK family protein, partial [Candidatus Promineifilaceae bacterium]
MSEYSDQEIDLRPYIEAVLNKWYWVVGAGVVFALIGVGIGLLRTQTFEATALVAITEPSQRVQFDPRIQTNVENQPVAAYPELALSDELLDAVISRLPENYDLTLTSLRGKLTAESGGDGSILRLSVSDADPAQAAEMANIWAALFVDWANQVYSGQGGEQ